MKKITYGLIAGVVFILVFASCQAVFTFSPFSALRRDPSKLPPEQKEAYARDALLSGDPATMTEAYNLVNDLLANDPANPGLNLLAVDLAIGASGLGNLVTAFNPQAGISSLNDILTMVDTSMLANVGDRIETAAAGGAEISSSQYVNAAAAIVITTAANLPNGFDDIVWTGDTVDPQIQTAVDYAALGGVTIETYFQQ
ncbi:MAG: hypothetical protein AB1798_04980 [Spirochaetota bacterium]